MTIAAYLGFLKKTWKYGQIKLKDLPMTMVTSWMWDVSYLPNIFKCLEADVLGGESRILDCTGKNSTKNLDPKMVKNLSEFDYSNFGILSPYGLQLIRETVKSIFKFCHQHLSPRIENELLKSSLLVELYKRTAVSRYWPGIIVWLKPSMNLKVYPEFWKIEANL